MLELGREQMLIQPCQRFPPVADEGGSYLRIRGRESVILPPVFVQEQREERTMEGHFFAARRRGIFAGLMVVALGCGIWFASAASGAPRAVGDSSQQDAVNALQQAQVVLHTYMKPTAVTTRAGSRCWGEVRDRYSLVFHGLTIAWAEVDQEGWCGNNTRITWQGGATYPKYHAPPYCWSDDDTSDTWLEYPAWRHARNTRQIGIPTPVGCIGLRTLHAHLRYAANGYWDHSY